MRNREPAGTELPMAAMNYFDHQGWCSGVHRWSVWAVAGVSVESLDVPRRIAEPTLEILQERDQHGPVVRVPADPERWTFIVQPALLPVAAVETLLSLYDVQTLRCQERILLPPSRLPNDKCLEWIVPPHPDGREPVAFAKVAMTVLAVVGALPPPGHMHPSFSSAASSVTRRRTDPGGPSTATHAR